MAKGDKEEDHRRIWLLAGACITGGALLWLAGWGLLGWLAPPWVAKWHGLWALAGVSFLGAVILPFPGSTAALMALYRKDLLVGGAGVLGTAIGGTVGAALLHGLGAAGRQWLRKRAHKGKWRRRVLAWSEAAVRHWTYLAVGVLLVPFFIPRVVVLYPAVALKLRAVPFLAAVFVGTLVRNALYFAAIVTGAKLLGL